MRPQGSEKSLKLTFERWHAIISSTSVEAAFLLVGTLSVIKAEEGTNPELPGWIRTHSWLI